MLFPPVVVGTFVTLIGVSLAPTAIQDLAGGAGSGEPMDRCRICCWGLAF